VDQLYSCRPALRRPPLATHDEIAHVTAIARPSTILATVVVRNTAGLYAC
jgi:hypothetical protein